MSDYSSSHWLKDQMQGENFHCMPDKIILSDPLDNGQRWSFDNKMITGIWPGGFFNLPLGIPIQEMKPDLWKIDKFIVYNLIDSLEAGLENTQDLLIEHDSNLGRTTTKNKSWAETLEKQIRGMEDCLKKLSELRVMHETSYP